MIPARTSRQRYLGLTLPEVMIAGTLMLLVLGVSMELTRMAYRTFQRSTTTTEYFRKQTVATDLLNRELRLCTEILNPRITEKDYTQNRVFRAGDGDDILIFRRFSPTLDAKSSSHDETVVSYRYDPKRKELIRETLNPNYRPDRPWRKQVSKERSPRVVAEQVEEFTFSVQNPDEHFGAFLVNFQLEVKVGEAISRIGSSVRVRSI